MMVITFWFKYSYKSPQGLYLLLLQSTKFIFGMTSLLQGALVGKTTEGWNSLLRVDLAMFQRWPLLCVAILPRFFQQITHRNYLSILRDQHDFNNFCKFELANFEKRWLYTSFGQPQKMNFSIKKGILGWVRVNDP